jgi:hypothetical protein
LSNLFSTLAKHGGSEVENYLTESFVLVLNQLLRRDELIAHSMIEKLLGIELFSEICSPASIRITTQVRVDGGIPDIEIRMPGEFHAYIEVKHDAHLGSKQLEFYKSVIEQSLEPIKVAVLLTRSKASSIETTLGPGEYHHVCWYEVHRWFSLLAPEDKVLKYLLHDFNAFLEAKRMSHQRIRWQYEEGVPALVDFTDMLASVLTEVEPNRTISRTSGWSWRGFNLDHKIFVGIRYDDPTRLVFEVEAGSNPTFKRDFVFSEAHFFSLDSGEQFEALADFIERTFSELPSKSEE